MSRPGDTARTFAEQNTRAGQPSGATIVQVLLDIIAMQERLIKGQPMLTAQAWSEGCKAGWEQSGEGADWADLTANPYRTTP